MSRILGIFTALLLLWPEAVLAEPKAFPTAVGYGASAKGGRGGSVRFVTNLNNSGAGSLREAVGGSGPRTVIFRVAGMITLTGDIKVTRGDLTIAGQTAPGGGVCIRNAGLVLTNGGLQGPNGARPISNFIIRHFCSRPGNAMPGSDLGNRDGISIERVTNAIIDHSSFSWSVDENATVYFPESENVTFQNNIFAEPLLRAGHPKGSHPMGVLVANGTSRITVYQNLFAHNVYRNPVIQSGSRTDVVNNVIYNWGAQGTSVTTGEFEYHGGSVVNIMGNIYQPPNTGDPRLDRRIQCCGGEHTPTGFQVHVSGNVDRSGASVPGPSNQYMFASPVGGGPFDVPMLSTSGLWDLVLNNAGRTKPQRDAVDKRIVADVRAGIDRTPDNPGEVGGYPSLASGTPYPDSDKDGMDDRWEIARGLSSSNAADRNGTNLSTEGYTNLEVFLNELAK
jgi:hypothetical protein